MTEKKAKPAPVKLDETQLDAAVGGIIAIAPIIGDPCTKVVRVAPIGG